GQGPGFTLQQRDSDGSNMQSPTAHNIGPVPGGFPRYMRLARSGDVFSAYTSVTGTDWQLLGSRTVPMGTDVQVGLAVTSHRNGTLCTAVFDNVSVQGSGTLSNQPPVAVAQSDVSVGTAPLSVGFVGSG